jgi:hypothetical protein
MVQRRSPFDPRIPGWLVTAVLTLAIGLTWAAGAPRRSERARDTWRAMVETGDELAAGQLTATLDGQPFTARKAYLLAFHQAQDAGDLEHVLAVADRLELAGEHGLAAHVRQAARALVDELARVP